jgi:hypothetical protein
MIDATTVPITRLSVGPERARLIRGRLEEIAGVLGIPRPAVDGAMSSDAKLVAFVYATNQSLDWVVLGNPASMIRALHRGGRDCWAPSLEALQTVGGY